MGLPNTDILSQIVTRKKEEIAAAKKAVPEKIIREKARLTREKRSFLKAFENAEASDVNIIAEIKRASPSKGVFSPDLDPVTTAVAYEKGGAVALSVLTDTDYFRGNKEDLTQARQACVLPVLRKDFLISEYQIYESAAINADAVLLIVRILTEQQLKDLMALAEEFNMDPLVEIHSMDDLEIAARAGARLIGINNRNLKSFDTDIDTAISMVSALAPFQIPIAASGIQSSDDILRNLRAGIHGFLIGESLVKASDPAKLIRSLIAAGKK